MINPDSARVNKSCKPGFFNAKSANVFKTINALNSSFSVKNVFQVIYLK